MRYMRDVRYIEERLLRPADNIVEVIERLVSLDEHPDEVRQLRAALAEFNDEVRDVRRKIMTAVVADAKGSGQS